ncbi:MAG: tRNA 2-thiouridine(34) synthase MnmA, partial [Candidatus Cloacimonadota bacterium]
EHYTIDVTELFHSKVIDYFVDDYKNGRTPNPCVVCNRKVKFKTLFDKAQELSAGFVATGHYAQIQKKNADYVLMKGKESKKDQSYFLAQLKQDWLKTVLFPVGMYTKKEVTKIAQQSQLPFYQKEESQEVCFIGGNDYRTFLLDKLPGLGKPGSIIDMHERIIGKHKGIFYYTIGQRKGIQVNSNIPLFVTAINTEENTITVGKEIHAYKNECNVEKLNWFVDPGKIPQNVFAKIRSQHNPVEANIEIHDARVIAQFFEPQMAITPGQLAVFYNDNIVLGSGWICER